MSAAQTIARTREPSHPRLRLATINGRRVSDRGRCDGPLFLAYQDAKAAWDHARNTDNPNRGALRLVAVAAYDAWAASCGLPPINSPQSWGFN
jgi:hypothetical protein